jgi:hypothetical protein
MRATSRTPENRARMGKTSEARWAEPAMREKIITGMRASSADPAVRQKKASVTRARWADPAMREKIIATMRAAGKRRRNRGTHDR